ncbi:RluA family pseudouridine synthase [Candidatus Nomurabacteria bacterium]|uniref:RluA family pseudouridine synthase n=1 Tax=candidate division WWE3 bacterium TaxID=2053526 RepID=A0A955E2J1_UNCKA|nr:RluA family pseudouridine synthase [candidate division WWE3 bacterium]MCB9823692.1 RluA family pseudouridine synthase [Candidatus Nomurabacteria bacterium]MCB9827230.1 RluA family pseudouridine synthase [Candidatus Nomurabacteria bacterium]MCB9827487.1 RluA family pseudouridine synthase [Candidatus Nomurabacteria bacterium]HXK52516.1 RluA family pseudouridine synthase [bacterium]
MNLKDRIIFEDDLILVLDKPAGVVVNISQTSPESTVQNFVAEYLNLHPYKDREDDFYQRCGIVHRLDKATSGVLVVAKTPDSFVDIQSLFKDRKIQKVYVAIVHGKIEDAKIIIDAPLSRDPKRRTKFAVVKGGKESSTDISVIKNFALRGEELTEVEVKPLTGRTHQIRVHLAAINSPIVGDVLYSTRKKLIWSQECGINRMLLHAKALTIPGYGEFQASVPSDFNLI